MVALNHPAQGNTSWFTPVDQNWTTIEQSLDQAICQGRLTLTSGTPVTTSDVTGATTLYFTPYLGSRVAIYSGTTWQLFTFSELNISLSGLTANTNYDVFLYNNSGTLTLELVAWTNDTTRATALQTQDGVWVKSGTTSHRYLGTIRTTGTTGQSEDSSLKRYVWNYFNRVPRRLNRIESTSSWTYGSTTWRQANGSTSNQVDVVVGIAEVLVNLWLLEWARSSTGDYCAVAIGEDSTSTPSSNALIASTVAVSVGGTQDSTTQSSLSVYPTLGYHFYAWLEKGGPSGTTTFRGTQSGTGAFCQCGLNGWIEG
jgi:hypothetical protein